MISSWMMYGASVTVLMGLAAYGIERCLQGRSGSTRWAWLGALIGTPLIAIGVTAGGFFFRRDIVVDAGEIAAIGAVVPETGPVVGLPGATGSTVALPDTAMVVLWMLASAALLLYGLRSFAQLRAASRRWEKGSMDGREVSISGDVGPAVIGFFRSRIVVPRWVMDRDFETRRLILAHEEEHIRARDPQVLLGALVLLIAVPLNLPLWWIVHRLRLAIEVDCDARVLRRGAEPGAYGSLLLDVSGHGVEVGMATALANPAAFLERRIRMITRRSHRASWKATVAAASIACAFLLVACSLTPPPLPAGGGGEPRLGSSAGRSAPTIQPAVEGGTRPEEATAGSVARATVMAPPPTAAGPTRSPGPEGTIRTVSQDTPEGETGQGGPDFTPREVPEAGAELSRSYQPAVRYPAAAIDTPAVATENVEDLQEIGREPVFTPRQVEPRLLNRAEFVTELARSYPAALRNAGIGGTVILWVFIDETGRVGNTLVQRSSGYAMLDELGQTLMREVAVFSPARNRDEPVPVWIQLPLTFETGPR